MAAVEGILINKFPYKEKNYIGHLLLRNGMKTSVIFYGAQGGGKKHKSSILQLGYLFKVNLSLTKKGSFELLNSKEYQEKWFHKHISDDPKAFYLLCFYCEFIEKFAAVAHEAGDLEESFDLHQGVFRLLSNAIFNLEKVISEKRYHHELELFTFLTKALVEFGIFPRTEMCAISGEKIDGSMPIALKADAGAFALMSMMSMEDQRRADPRHGLVERKALLDISSHKYGEIQNFEGVDLECCRDILEYICYQQHIHLKDFKTLAMIL
jgi:recombinational DNA repair protein (RecF pathway)